jgi:60 kDa SS-A/Ro ribonucleoprotein
MQKIHAHYSTKKIPQSQAIPGKKQVKNSAGGFSFPVDQWMKLDRFLILGSEGGSYYASEKTLTVKNADNVKDCIAADGERTVRRIVEISRDGRAPKNDPALFALAMATKFGNEATRKAAFAALPHVARIGTHLFHFAEYRQAFGGWGRGTTRAVANWYIQRPLQDLALQLAKYQSRDGWAHSDLLRLAHPKSDDAAFNDAVKWALGKEGHKTENTWLVAVDQMKRTEKAGDAVKLISEHNLPREVVPTQLLANAEVWRALYERMPMTALIRNLGNMSKVGLITPNSVFAKDVAGRLTDAEQLKKARVHPLQVLMAMATYSQGHGMKGKGEWTPARAVTDALGEAFYLAFKNVVPMGKRIVIGLDISGSMSQGDVAGTPLTPRDASCAMCLVTARVEKDYEIMAFTTAFEPTTLTGKTTLVDAIKESERLSQKMGGTDCSLPMTWALKNKVDADAFLVYTDSETWAGHIHPTQALQKYREARGIPAKLVVVGLVANEFSVADPDDGGMMDVVGFDTAAPALISDFVRG